MNSSLFFNLIVNRRPVVIFGWLSLEHLVVHLFSPRRAVEGCGLLRELGSGGCHSLPGMWPGLSDNEPPFHHCWTEAANSPIRVSEALLWLNWETSFTLCATAAILWTRTHFSCWCGALTCADGEYKRGKLCWLVWASEVHIYFHADFSYLTLVFHCDCLPAAMRLPIKFPIKVSIKLFVCGSVFV